MNLYTIGFTKKTAQSFFESLSQNHVNQIVDVRLNNVSQLAGFAKKTDLIYFLQTIGDIKYVHEPLLAPTQEMLDDYKKKKGSWSDYEQRFLALLESREIQKRLSPELFTDSCLLCSEDKPHHCHRRLVAEYLNAHWGNITIKHIE